MTIPQEVINHILQLSLRSPSSFNLQPYNIILIKDPKIKSQLAETCMLGGNAQKIKESSVSAIFCANLESYRHDRKFQAYCQKYQSFPDKLIRKIPFLSKIFSTSHRFQLIRWIMFRGKQIAFTLITLPYVLLNKIFRLLSPSIPLFGTLLKILIKITKFPRVESSQTWAVKNVSFVAQTFMLACASFGLATCPMEGFDAWKVKELCSIPSYYNIPLIVSVGYPEDQEVKSEKENKKAEGGSIGEKTAKSLSFRYPLKDVCFQDHYGKEIEESTETEFVHLSSSIPPFSVSLS